MKFSKKDLFLLGGIIIVIILILISGILLRKFSPKVRPKALSKVNQKQAKFIPNFPKNIKITFQIVGKGEFGDLGGTTMPPVYFSHSLHTNVYQIPCATCHHGRPKTQKAAHCGTCHGSSRQELLQAYFTKCTECHRKISWMWYKADAPLPQVDGCQRCHFENPSQLNKEKIRINKKLTPSRIEKIHQLLVKLSSLTEKAIMFQQ
ncbi:cytochrome c3 family protein [Desulfonauticus submarinus]